MVKNKNMLYIFLFLFIVLTLALIVKYTTNEGFQYRNCSSITTCKVCADTRGCTFCDNKCVNDDATNSQCGSSRQISDSQFCPEVTASCESLTNCKTCADRLDCTFCKSSNKCVDASKTEQLCPRESTVSVPEGCETTGLITDSSGNLYSDLYGQCSRATNCNQCLSTPACYWCPNQNQCVSNTEVYEKCMNDNIITSFSQCSNNNEPTYSSDINGTILTPISESSVSVGSNEITVSSNNTLGLSGLGSVTMPMESTVNQYPHDSIIPVLGLSRTSTGLLTDSSIQIIIDGIKSRGYTLRDTQSKNKVLELIQKELKYYMNQSKNNVSNYVTNSMDYISDGTSLNKARNNQQHIEDLKMISRYVESINTSTFAEAYLDLDTQKTKFEHNVQRVKASNFVIETLWLANLVVLGFIFFV